jgi:hypothetical protein
MRFIYFVIIVFFSILTGFYFAGVFGALAFGLINMFGLIVFKKNSQNWKIGTKLGGLILFSLLGYSLMLGFGLLNANENVHKKVEGIRKELIKQGYNPRWYIISQKRYKFYNDLLINSVKNDKSKHLVGKAIDLFIIDINGDGVYNFKDFELIEKAESVSESKIKETRGNVFHYFGKGQLKQNMVHVEID